MRNAILKYRRANDLTLDQFANLVGVQKSAVWKWENGIVPSPAKAIEIEEATGGKIRRWQLRPDLWNKPREAAE